MSIYRTYKFKLKLNKGQEKRIAHWMGVCRLVHNFALEIQITAYRNVEKQVSNFDLMKQITELRQEYDWVEDVPAYTLRGALARVNKSYDRFFKGLGRYPKFDRKKDNKSIQIESKFTKFVDDNTIRIPKIGNVKVFKNKSIEGIAKGAFLKKFPNGYFVILQCEIEREKPELKLQSENQAVGIDLGISHFAVTSDGLLIPNLKLFQKYQKQRRALQRSLSRKKKGSKNYNQVLDQLAKLEHKIGNTRKDYLHKRSTILANKYDLVCLEDLNILALSSRCRPVQDENGNYLPNGQSRKSGLNRSIRDQGWGFFKNCLSYKSNVILVPPRFTSQTCNKCKHCCRENRPTQVAFHCVNCGHKDLADRNAAKNIKELGLEFYYREASSLEQGLVMNLSNKDVTLSGRHFELNKRKLNA